MRVQEIAKKLNQAGLRKATNKKVDFKTVQVGDYTAREFNFKGILCWILPVNGMTCERIINILSESGLTVYENKGYVVVNQ